MREVSQPEMFLAAGAPKNMDTITVTGSRLKSSFTASQIGMTIDSVGMGGGTEPLEDHEGPIEDTDSASAVAEEYLRNHPNFKALPASLRNLILKSPMAISLFASFFAKGGTIAEGATSAAQYFDGNPPRIEVSAVHMDRLRSAEASGNLGNVDYYAKMITGNLAHEIGHFTFDHVDFDRTGGLLEYEVFRTRYESIAIYMSLMMGAEMGFSPGGYGTPLALKAYYNDYLATGDWNRFMETLDNVVRTQPWQDAGAHDANGDGQTTHLDKFRAEYPYGK